MTFQEDKGLYKFIFIHHLFRFCHLLKVFKFFLITGSHRYCNRSGKYMEVLRFLATDVDD